MQNSLVCSPNDVCKESELQDTHLDTFLVAEVSTQAVDSDIHLKRHTASITMEITDSWYVYHGIIRTYVLLSLLVMKKRLK